MFLKSAPTTALMLITGLQLCQAMDKLSNYMHTARPENVTTPKNVSRDLYTNERDLQLSNFSYRANYTAQFQYIKDSVCFGPAPVVQVFCHSPNMHLLGTSDASILCDSPALESDGWTTITCNTTCASDAACQSVYLVQNANINQGYFGEIRFLCEGDTAYNVDAAMWYNDSGVGGCAGTSNGYSRSYHIARMGVSCPTGSGGRNYLFDNFYFHCLGYGNGTYNAYPGEGDPGNVYTCYTGKNCNGTECDVNFLRLSIEADLPNFLNSCVETSGAVTSFPTPAPFDFTKSQLHPISARFEAAWGVLLGPPESGSG